MEEEPCITPERVKKDVEHLKEWLSKQPHLPKIEDDIWLSTYHHHNKYSLEKTKTKLDNYFSFKNKYPDALKNRDPLSDEVTKARKALNLSLSTRLTKDGERILFSRFYPDTSLFNIWRHLKYGYMVVDLFYLEEDRHEHVLQVSDCKHLSYTHFLKALPGLKAGVDIFFSAYSDRLKAFHIINCPAGLEYIINTFKGFFPPKIAERFFVHSSTDGLINMVDEDVVCRDFGGKGPSLDECDEYTAKLMERHRTWYLEQNNKYTNEDLRRKTDGQEVEEMQGSFRKLQVD